MMLAPPATVRVDLDRDGDQEEFAYFQACLSGPDVQLVPGCEGADLDSDGDVHQDDFGVCQACMSGANIPADPNCADGSSLRTRPAAAPALGVAAMRRQRAGR